MPTRVHPDGRPLASGRLLRLVLVLDLLLNAVLSLVVVREALAGRVATAFAVGTGLHLLLVLVTDLGAVGLRAAAMVWRRRIAFVAVLAVLWRGNPLEGTAWPWVVVLDAAVVWIALLAEGRRMARAVAEATGEHVLSLDPTRPDR